MRKPFKVGKKYKLDPQSHFGKDKHYARLLGKILVAAESSLNDDHSWMLADIEDETNFAFLTRDSAKRYKDKDAS